MDNPDNPEIIEIDVPSKEEMQKIYDDILRKLHAHIPSPTVAQLRCMLQIIVQTLICVRNVDTQMILEWFTQDCNSAWGDLKQKAELKGMKES